MGPRALAWISGVVLFGVFLFCGWTGYVMVWDTQGQWMAMEGARLFDVLPIFSEPIARTFVGERAMPSAFFFINLFAHIAVPVGILLILLIHVSRLARTYLLPPRELFWGAVGALTLFSVAWPAVLGPEADLLTVPGDVAVDLFYGFWLPLSQSLPAGVSWLGLLAGTGLAVAVPWMTRPAPADAPPPSWLKRDRPVYVFHDQPVAPGTYAISVTFSPIVPESVPEMDAPVRSWAGSLSLDARQIGLLTLDATGTRIEQGTPPE